MIDYSIYQFSKAEWVESLVLSIGVTTLLTYLFYRSIIAVVLGLPFACLIIKKRRKQLIDARYWTLNMEFKEVINSISTAMSAGYSIENAITEAIKDLHVLLGEESYMITELEYMRQQIYLNRTVEDIFTEFASRARLEDVQNFVDVFSAAKRTGGDIIKIIRSTSKSISDKIEIKREIETMIMAKKYEAKIMCLMPLGIITYMWVASPGYLDPLYHNILGILIMTVLLGIYLAAYLLTEKIMDIQV